MVKRGKLSESSSNGREYVRDKRSPKPKNSKVSELMSQIKAKNTKPEILIRKALYSSGVRGYRLHWKINGKPDIAFPGKKIAIFIHGCFWHRCPYCKTVEPKTNSEFWAQKFSKNVQRDKRKTAELKLSGWRVLVFWECKIKNNTSEYVRIVKEVLKDAKD